MLLLTRKFQAVYLTQSRASQRQRDFTNALAHEMKTPLGVIRGYSELMQEGIAPEKHPAYLAGIVGETGAHGCDGAADPLLFPD